MSEGDPKLDGWFESLRRSGDSLLGLAQSRIELLTVELQEEKLRAIRLLVWLVVALALGVAGILTGLGAAALFLWDVAGYGGLILLSLVPLGGAAAVLWSIRQRVQNGPPPFSETVAEFKKDRECLRKRN
jgi:uncharacterized membrane protein YqjE